MIKKMLLITAFAFATTASHAYVIKQAKTDGECPDKTQTAIVQCQNFDDTKSTEVCVVKRKVKVQKNGQCEGWKAWTIVGKGGAFKKWEDAAEQCCLDKNLK